MNTMKEQGCFIPVEAVGRILRGSDNNIIGVSNNHGSYDYGVGLKPVLKAQTLGQKLVGIGNYQEALAIIERNK